QALSTRVHHLCFVINASFVIRHWCFVIYEQQVCEPSIILRSCSRARADRRHDDCDGVDDRLGDFYHIGRIVAAERRAWLVAPRVGGCRLANDYWRALLLG